MCRVKLNRPLVSPRELSKITIGELQLRSPIDAMYGGYAGATLIEIDDDVGKEY